MYEHETASEHQVKTNEIEFHEENKVAAAYTICCVYSKRVLILTQLFARRMR